MSAGGTFYDQTVRGAADSATVAKFYRATYRQYEGRANTYAELGDVEAFRQAAADLRDHTLKHLDHYLGVFCDNLQRKGVTVHWAATGDDATEAICRIARDSNATRIVKGKSMASEEISLNDGLEADGLEVTETDLGEYIVQLARARPGHLVGPSVHFSMDDIAALFREKIGYRGPVEPEALCRAARVVLREKFLSAEMGVTGVNFGAADPGLIGVATNEGNGRFCTARRVYVGLMGMERLVPDLAGAMLVSKLLGRFNGGQRNTQYVNFVGGPCAIDGPREVHVVILDNFRSRLLASKYWRVLRCIRCASCVNACPVFRHIGGHRFPICYSGPIGLLLSPAMIGLENEPDVPKACSLCNLCSEVCSTKIPIADILLEYRNDLFEAGRTPFLENVGMRLMAWGMRHPSLFGLGQKAMRWALKPISRDGWVRWLPSMAGRWTAVKDFPLPARRSFMATFESDRDRKGDAS